MNEKHDMNDAEIASQVDITHELTAIKYRNRKRKLRHVLSHSVNMV